MSPATQEAFRAVMRGLLKSGALASKAQAEVIVREIADAVPDLEDRDLLDEAKCLEGLVADLTADLR